jgi:polar amino acid transport system ATP-binding protein
VTDIRARKDPAISDAKLLHGSHNLVVFRDVSKLFGSHRVLDHISLEIAKGEIVVICGPSGAGKTTLLRTINRLESVQEGEVLVAGKSLSDPKTNLTALRADIGMVFQHWNLYPHLTVLENIMLAPRKVRRLSKDEAKERALQSLRDVGLERKRDVYPAQLSGGEQQRVAIARSVAMKPKLMLLDEPTSALDPELVQEVLDAVTALAKSGMTMIVVTHQMLFAERVAHRAVFMDEGKIIEIAPPTDLVTNPKAQRTRRFMAQILRGIALQPEVAATHGVN